MNSRKPLTQVRQERRGPLTLPEIRAIRRHKSDDWVIDKRLADAFTLEGADGDEMSFLTACRAVYARSQNAFSEDNVPAEKLICSLLFQISYWPLTLEDVQETVDEMEHFWKQRKEAAHLVREELEETSKLQKQCGGRRVECEWPDNAASRRIQ